MSIKVESRNDEFKSLFEENIINLEKLKKYAINGCADNVRPVVWKILLNFLPLQKNHQESFLKEARRNYQNYIKEFILNGCKNSSKNDHPLNSDPNSTWVEYFKDNEVLLQINKDCKRLCPDLNLFQLKTEYPFGNLASNELEGETLRKRVENSMLETENFSHNRMGMNIGIRKDQSKNHQYYLDSHEKINLPEDQEYHWEVAQRLLFIYCKTNKAHSYVQGMNEIIGPIYYVFATDENIESRKFAEADTFYCFIELMRDVQPLFIKSLDSDPLCGLNSRLNQLMNYLKDIDLQLSYRLQEVKVLPEYFAFRWVTLYLSREFTMPDVIRFWDTLFSVKNRIEFMIYSCCTLIIILKDDLMVSNFAQSMDLLQNIQTSSMNIDDVIRKALEYYFRFGDC